MPKKKLLIVEDEVITAFSLQMDFENLGYVTCKMASSGEDAISIARKEHPDVVVMDINLSGKINGFQAAETIRLKQNMPIIFLSGYCDNGVIEKVNQIQNSICLSKPIDSSIVHQAIQKLLKE